MSKKTRRTKRKRGKADGFSFEKLEERNLMATFSLVTQGGETTLVMRGTAQADTIQVSESGSQVTAQVNNQLKTYNSNQVDKIKAIGYGGNDTITNNTGMESWLAGGSGNDTLTGGSAADTIYGQLGDDVSEGRGGNDTIADYGGDNTMRGGSGDDKLYGGSGNDTIYGGSGSDRLVGKSGVDHLYPEAGGVAGNGEFIRGGVGNDFLYGGDGRNNFVGEQGNDTYIIRDNNSSEYGFDGITEEAGEGNDTIDTSDVNVKSVFDHNDRVIVNYGPNRHLSISQNVEGLPTDPGPAETPQNLNLAFNAIDANNQFMSEFEIIVPHNQGNGPDDPPPGTVELNDSGRIFLYDSGWESWQIPAETRITSAGVVHRYEVFRGGRFQHEYRVIVRPGTFSRGGHENPQMILRTNLSVGQLQPITNHVPKVRGNDSDPLGYRFVLNLTAANNGRTIEASFVPGDTELLVARDFRLRVTNSNGTQSWISPSTPEIVGVTYSTNEIIYRYDVSNAITYNTSGSARSYEVFFEHGAFEYFDASLGADTIVSDSAAIRRIYNPANGSLYEP